MSACAGSRRKSPSPLQDALPISSERKHPVRDLVNHRVTFAARVASECRMSAGVGLWTPTETKHQVYAGPVFFREGGLKINIVEIHHQC
jgi:hypothetical protein